MSHFDPCTNQCELEVQRIIHLKNIANQLLDAFIDTKKVTKSHIPATNAPTWINVPEGQLENESKIRLKCGRPVELNSLMEHDVFGPLVQTPKGVKPVG